MTRRLFIALILALAALVFVEPTRSLLEHRLHVARLGLDALTQDSGSPIVILAIDEASIDAIGSWPWPRATWAELLTRLYRHHRPGFLGLDAVFPPAPEQAAGNEAFAAALAQVPSALGQLMLPDPGMRGATPWLSLTHPLPDGFPPADTMRFAGVLGSDAKLATTARAGHINAAIDPDGVMRRLPTLICLESIGQPCAGSFVQAAAATLAGADEWAIQRGGWLEAPWLLVPGDLDALAIPVGEDLTLAVPWRGSHDLRYVSIADVWHERLAAGLLDQRLLLVGGVSLGLGDMVVSPLYERVPGIEVHAHALRAWLANALPFQPRAAQPAMLAWALAVGLLLAWYAQRRAQLIAITTVGALAPLAGALLAWLVWRQIWPAGAPASFALIAGVALTLSLVLRERSRLVQRFRDYVPLPLRRLLTRADTEVPSETGWGTVMVTDILGYTRRSQSLPLEQLAAWCDAGVAHVVHHAVKHGAMLDTVAGDGALLLWRTGGRREQARAAIAAVRDIMQGMPELNRRLAAQGLPELALGIGVHAGPYLLGSFGEEHKRFTVVSDVANLAAHIERLTRHHPWPVLVSQTVASLLPAGATVPAATLDLGAEHMPLFTLADLPNNHWPNARPAAAS
ncbi:adenylate/guanylate cyclase domain-containing protein [Verticiella sediminum]|uniref:Adenylate/guanylate cyclase domain-containing protein n=1 Tax=Verticiella sediminum TaxID=1247510 RepID=A0A556AKE6_9BURK|nr:adenylate/guanylate cyclase domain-containing protein [Verticiella sediminum]TSH93368.1 adenylate/guanylate cyclase domain-containing protein [Verticiella sediminum]